MRTILGSLLSVSTALLTVSAWAAELPSPALLVLNKSDATLVIVDPATGRITGKVATGEGPHEVVVNAEGTVAYATNYGSGPAPGKSISIIELAGPSETKRLDVAPMLRPHGIALAEGKVWFTAEANKVVARYDPAAQHIDYLLGTGQNTTHMIQFSADTNRFFTANISSDSISIFERPAGSMNWNQTVVPVGKGPEAFDVSPDGSRLWTAHSRDGGVSVIDLSTKKVVETLPLGTKRSNRLKFTPDGKTVLISDLDAGDLFFVDVASRKVTKKLPLGQAPEGILIEPGGARAYVAVAGDNYVAVIDLASMTKTKQIETGGGPDGMAWIGGALR
ncbi:MAG: YncE family protein [Paludibaculum sp.]